MPGSARFGVAWRGRARLGRESELGETGNRLENGLIPVRGLGGGTSAFRVKKVRGWELSVSLNVRPGGSGKRYFVNAWQQPWWDWLVAHLYHKYDMLIFRVPGYKFVESWLYAREARRLGTDDPMPLGAKQDIRCYYLTRRNRVDVARQEIDQATYDKLRG